MVGANRGLRRSISAVSKEPGPLLVIVDRAGQLRSVTVTPKTPAEMHQFAALLNSYTTAEQ